MRPPFSDKCPSCRSFLRWALTVLLDAIFIAVWMSLIDGVAPVFLTAVSMCFSIFCVVVSFIMFMVGRSSGPHSPGGPLSLCSTVTPAHLPLWFAYGWMRDTVLDQQAPCSGWANAQRRRHGFLRLVDSRRSFHGRFGYGSNPAHLCLQCMFDYCVG